MPSLKKMSRKEQVGAVIGIISSVLGIALWIILAFVNPYSKVGITDAAVKTTFVMLALPAIGGLIASVFGKRWLMLIVLVALLPALPSYLYMAGTPGIFKFFGLVLLGYILSTVLMMIGKRKDLNHDK